MSDVRPQDFLDDLARFRRAQFMFEQKLYVDAARELETLLSEADAQHGLSEARLLLARSYFHSAQLGKAEELTRSLVADHPADGYAVALLARTLQRQGRHEDAAPYLERARVMGQEV